MKTMTSCKLALQDLLNDKGMCYLAEIGVEAHGRWRATCDGKKYRLTKHPRKRRHPPTILEVADDGTCLVEDSE